VPAAHGSTAALVWKLSRKDDAIMENGVIRRAVISIIIGVIMQIVLLLYLTNNVNEFSWKLIAGSGLLTTGFLFVYNLFSVKKTYFKEKRILFWAFIINPCLFNIFLGTGLIAGEYPQMKGLHIGSLLAVILSILIGFIMLIVALLKKNEVKI
jgi:hypothetical protein